MGMIGWGEEDPSMPLVDTLAGYLHVGDLLQVCMHLECCKEQLS